MNTKKRPRPRTGNKTSPRRVRTVERDAKALQLRAEGATLQQIADRLNIAVGKRPMTL